MTAITTIVGEFFSRYKEIPVDSIEIKEEVRRLCEQNTCGNYNKNWTCPPAVGPLEESIRKFRRYTKFILIYQVYELKSSFDWRGMQEGGIDFGRRLVALKRRLEETEDVLILGAGGCRLCPECTYASGKPCRNPEDAIISCEAYGIDVMSLMRKNGLPYYNGPNTMTLVAGVLYGRRRDAATA
ncbi:MAG: DUF2284 domain-containing protein [Firmicutes bacterium]|jgi:predicted metal-binding protein|nr:DUF2284 domain-containing protein [Bacillota bacterium]